MYLYIIIKYKHKHKLNHYNVIFSIQRRQNVYSKINLDYFKCITCNILFNTRRIYL